MHHAVNHAGNEAQDYLIKPYLGAPRPEDVGVRVFAARYGDGNCCLESVAHAHRHPVYEISYLTQGSATFFVDFERYPAHAGTLAFIFPGQVHAWTDKTSAEIISVAFRPEVFALNGQDIASQLRGLPFDTAWASPRCIHLTTAAHQATFHSLFATLLSKQAAPAEQRERLLLAYLNVVLAEILPLCSPGTPAQAPSAAARLTRAFQSAVEACYLERKQVQAYAAELGVTPGHLIEAVRQVTGDTPGHLLERRLLLEAKRLLIHTACSVSEIAAALSFTSASQFGRWFRHLTDLAPGEFRRQFSVGFDA